MIYIRYGALSLHFPILSLWTMASPTFTACMTLLFLNDLSFRKYSLC